MHTEGTNNNRSRQLVRSRASSTSRVCMSRGTQKLNTWSQQLWRPWADNFEKLRLNNRKPNRTGCQNGHDAAKEAMNSGVGNTSLRLQAVRFLPTFYHHLQDRSSPCLNFYVVDFNPVRLRVHPPTSTQLHAFVWRQNSSGSRYFVCGTLEFSKPNILEARLFTE